MPFGYSHDFVVDITSKYKSDPKNPVYRLGYLAVKHGIMLSEVADRLGVSKQAVYKWFEGAYQPKEKMLTSIKALNKELRTLKKRK